MSTDTSINMIKTAIQAFLGTYKFVSVMPILTGFSFAKNYKVLVQEKSYFVRLLSTKQEASSREKEALMIDLASQHQLGPRLNYRNEDNTVFIIDFVTGASLTINDFHQPSFFNEVVDFTHSLHQLTVSGVPHCIGALQRIHQYSEHANTELIKRFIEIDAVQIPLMQIDNVLKPHRTQCLVHNDLNIENFYRAETGELLLLDWADSGLGDPYLDLSMLAMLLNDQQREDLLTRYFKTPTELQRAQLYLNCALCFIVFAAWGLQQIKSNNYTMQHAKSLTNILSQTKPRFINLIEQMKAKSFAYHSGEAFQQCYEICLHEFFHYIDSDVYVEHMKVCQQMKYKRKC